MPHRQAKRRRSPRPVRRTVAGEKLADARKGSGRAPPARHAAQEAAQPGDDELKPVLAWLEAFVERSERETVRADRVMIRRLNRAEYNNTVRDLLGVDFRPADDFPPDVPGHGFDNIAGSLSVSPVLVEKYLAAAEKVARTAVFGVEPMKPERVAHQPLFTADAFSKNRGVKFDYDETGMSLPSALHVVQRFAVDGEYTLRGILRGVRPAGSDPVELGFWIDGKMVHAAKIPVPDKIEAGRNPGELNGLWAEFRTPITAGEHWLSVTVLRMYEGLPAAYKGPKPAKAEGRPGNRGVDAFFPMYLDVVGPRQAGERPSADSLKKIFGDNAAKGPRDAAAVRKIVADLARRAYRRPVTDKEVDDLVKLVAMVQKDGDSFEEGLCLAIQQMLISPHFLFRVEKAPTDSAQHELATRLSYFLWSSMPDDELSRCADAGKAAAAGGAGSPGAADAQGPEGPRPGRELRRAMAANAGPRIAHARPHQVPGVHRLHAHVDEEGDGPVLRAHPARRPPASSDFLDANYTFLNQRLAEFYGIPGVKGHEFRKVDLTGSGRGGVWTHGERADRVVVRQPNLARAARQVDSRNPAQRAAAAAARRCAHPRREGAGQVRFPARATGEAPGQRDLCLVPCPHGPARVRPGTLRRHRPLARQGRQVRHRCRGDAAGRQVLQRADGLAAVLKADAGAFAECLAEKMLIYALGRGLDRSDRKTVKAIAERMARDDYRFSSLVLGIVQSEPFQTRK